MKFNEFDSFLRNMEVDIRNQLSKRYNRIYQARLEKQLQHITALINDVYAEYKGYMGTANNRNSITYEADLKAITRSGCNQSRICYSIGKSTQGGSV